MPQPNTGRTTKYPMIVIIETTEIAKQTNETPMITPKLLKVASHASENDLPIVNVPEPSMGPYFGLGIQGKLGTGRGCHSWSVVSIKLESI